LSALLDVLVSAEEPGGESIERASSDPTAAKLANKAGAIRRGVGGAKGGVQSKPPENTAPHLGCVTAKTCHMRSSACELVRRGRHRRSVAPKWERRLDLFFGASVDDDQLQTEACRGDVPLQAGQTLQ